MVTEGEQVALGGNDMYVSLCRKHFMNGDIGPAFLK
jgi:thymidine kinase